MHRCESGLSREAIDGWATGIGATLEPIEATAVDIHVVIPDAGARITRACVVLLELSIDTSSGH
jgi:hypothetical protein